SFCVLAQLPQQIMLRIIMKSATAYTDGMNIGHILHRRGPPPWNRRRELLGVQHATEAQRTGSVHTGRRQQQLAVLIEPVRLGKIPDRALRLVIASPAENAAPGMLIDILLRP